MSAGYSVDCPCIDSTPILLSSAIPKCSTENGFPGVLNKYGICYPVTYGSNTCAEHDIDVDPRCSSNNPPPEYCHQSWCFVDPTLCKASSERYFSSDIFDEEELYYSYTTCGSSHDFWLDAFSTSVLEGANLTAVIPALYYPVHYKISTSGGDRIIDEYYNESIPWQGWMVDYFDKIVEISNIHQVTYTHQSKGSETKSNSIWTQSVHDVHTGIASMGLSNFWITAERLKYVTYSVPLKNEDLFLFAKSPLKSEKDEDSYLENMSKTFLPFKMGVWIFIALVFALVGWLKIAFSTRGSPDRYWHQLRSDKWKKSSYPQRAYILCSLGFESVVYESTHAMSSSVDVTYENSLSQKLLSVGFAFFLLIIITSYTANLAAFLTLSIVKNKNHPKNIDEAINNGWKICSYPGIRQELEERFRPESFVYFESVGANLEAYKEKACKGIILSLNDFLQNTDAMSDFCDEDLVKTGPPVIQKYVGFPVSSEIAAGISYWIQEAEKLGISYATYEEKNRPPPPLGCSFEITDNANPNTYRISLEDFALPTTFLFVCIGLAMLNQLLKWVRVRKKALKSDELGSTWEMSNDNIYLSDGSLSPKCKEKDEVSELYQMLDEVKYKLGQMSTFNANSENSYSI